MSSLTDAVSFLEDLADRLERIPTQHGVEQKDSDTLRRIAEDMLNAPSALDE